jgi:hypothetical protein
MIEIREVGMQSEYLTTAHTFGLDYELLDLGEFPQSFEAVTGVLAAHLARNQSAVDDWPPNE